MLIYNWATHYVLICDSVAPRYKPYMIVINKLQPGSADENSHSTHRKGSSPIWPKWRQGIPHKVPPNEDMRKLLRSSRQCDLRISSSAFPSLGLPRPHPLQIVLPSRDLWRLAPFSMYSWEQTRRNIVSRTRKTYLARYLKPFIFICTIV